MPGFGITYDADATYLLRWQTMLLPAFVASILFGLTFWSEVLYLTFCAEVPPLTFWSGVPYLTFLVPYLTFWPEATPECGPTSCRALRALASGASLTSGPSTTPTTIMRRLLPTPAT
eukprot:2666438-Rhodomonas_salina.3